MAYSILIPSRNIDNLLACVKAVRIAGEAGRVIVLWDDGAMIQDANLLEALDVTILHCDPPFGFARNCNIGIRAAAPDDVVLLNDDALLETGGLAGELGSFANLVPEIGYDLVGATTNVTGHIGQLRRRYAAQLYREVRASPSSASTSRGACSILWACSMSDSAAPESTAARMSITACACRMSG